MYIKMHYVYNENFNSYNFAIKEGEGDMVNLYKILGVSHTISKDELIVLLTNPEIQAPTKVVEKAREWLLNDSVRVEYDAKLKLAEPDFFENEVLENKNSRNLLEAIQIAVEEHLQTNVQISTIANNENSGAMQKEETTKKGFFGKFKKEKTEVNDSDVEESGGFFKKINIKGKVTDSIKIVQEKASSTITEVKEFDYTQLKSKEFYQESYSSAKTLSTKKVNQIFDLDKHIENIIEDLDKRLPARPKDINDIYDQCKKEALSRAISVFALAPLMSNIDSTRASYFNNLSDTYTDLNKGDDSLRYQISTHENYVSMQNIRSDARSNFSKLDNGYNHSEPLDPFESRGIAIDHIVSANEIYDDFFTKLGTTNEGILDVMNDTRNLTFVDNSLNSAKGSLDLMEYIGNNSTPHPVDPNKVLVTIKSTGKQVEVDKRDVEEKYAQAKQAQMENRMAALKNIGVNVASSSAVMAAQQVVGLIVAETIDIFIDGLKEINFKDNLTKPKQFQLEITSKAALISERLKIRFEEKDLYNRAKAAGLEGSIAGAIAVIPQIIISLYLKMPALIFAIVRESTLSLVKGIRVLRSNNEEKYNHLKIIFLSTATAVASVYVANLISKAIMPVPLLNAFNSQVTQILATLVVTAIPLAAIYTYDSTGVKIKQLFANKSFLKDKQEVSS